MELPSLTKDFFFCLFPIATTISWSSILARIAFFLFSVSWSKGDNYFNKESAKPHRSSPPYWMGCVFESFMMFWRPSRIWAELRSEFTAASIISPVSTASWSSCISSELSSASPSSSSTDLFFFLLKAPNRLFTWSSSKNWSKQGIFWSFCLAFGQSYVETFHSHLDIFHYIFIVCYVL